MKTRILPPTDGALREAAKLLRGGELVAMPTETVYGLAANALDEAAVAKIFEAKGRPGDNPLIVHIADIADLAPLIACEPSASAKALMTAFWPGPLTMIFPKSNRVSNRVSGNLDTVAIRFPQHPVALALIRESGLPLAAPSANRSGKPSPTTAAHVYEDMDGRIELILDGGACEVGLESTVLDMTGEVPRILRPGGITAEMIAEVVGAATVDPAVLRPLGENEAARSPGMKYKHYAPKGELTIVHGNEANVVAEISRLYDSAVESGLRPLILALDAHLAAYGNRKTERLGANADAMAHNIFAALRDADVRGVDVLFSESVEATGIGLAVMNRLGRAAAFRIIEV